MRGVVVADRLVVSAEVVGEALVCPLGHGHLVRLPGEPEPADDWDWPGNAAA
jgi:hypothetical protein